MPFFLEILCSAVLMMGVFFAASVENRSAQPPITLADHPVQDSDIRLVIMQACVEAWHMLRKRHD